MRLSGSGWSVRGTQIDFGPSDDKESIRIINMAIDMGIEIFDTASIYGAGHNERLLGKALGKRRDDVIIISKAGWYFDEEKRSVGDSILDNPEYIKIICEDSLKRLGTDHIDIYLLHTFYKDDMIDLEAAAKVRDCMEELVKEGKLRWYGWSTDWPHQLKVFMEGAHCACTEQDFNIFVGNEETLKLCEDNDLVSFSRRPLASGSLIKKRSSDSYKKVKISKKEQEKLDSIREIITSRGETVAQGALCWLWAKSKVTLPIPGFRTEDQARDLIGTLEFGPLEYDKMEEIERIKNKGE